MVIKNKWKQALGKAGKTQLDMAKMLEIDTPTMSRVVKGDGMLPKDKLMTACDLLNVKPTYLYDYDILQVIYRIGIQKPKPTTVSVRIGIEFANILDGLEESRRETIERLIGEAYGTDKR